MTLIKDGHICKDEFTLIADEDALPTGGIIISLTRLQNEVEDLRMRNAPLGVLIRADTLGKQKAGEDVRALAPFLTMIDMVALDFPAFTNGRGFSSARILREDMGFGGEIRAMGDVAYDQWLFMARCGINAFAVKDNITTKQFNTAMSELSDAYQPAADDKRGILWKRSG